MGKTEKCGDDEEEEERKKERSKIASPCKNVYLTVVPVHNFAPCVVFPHLCVVLCWCDILFYVVCFLVVSRTLFPYFFLS